MPLPCRWQPRSLSEGQEHWHRRRDRCGAAFYSCGQFHRQVWCFLGGIHCVDCRPNSGGGERTSAKYLLGFEVVVVKADDVSDAPGHSACNRPSSGHLPFQWEGIDIGR